MSVSEDDKVLLDGILFHAAQNRLSLLRVKRKSDGVEVTLLCCNEIETDGKINLVPVAELSLGTSLDSYEFPSELTQLSMARVRVQEPAPN